MDTLKIEITVSLAGNHSTIPAGTTVEKPAAEAQRLIDKGFAKLVEKPATKTAKTTATKRAKK